MARVLSAEHIDVEPTRLAGRRLRTKNHVAPKVTVQRTPRHTATGEGYGDYTGARHVSFPLTY
jgi:hypothetical protein